MNNQNIKTQTLLDCIVCGVRINRQSLKKISQKNDSVLAFCNCPNCGAASFSLASRRMDESLVVGEVLTDLDAQEAGEFIKMGVISTDEFLEIIEELSFKS